MIAIFTGIIAGIIHVWSGPDHLTAIAPLALTSRKSYLTGIRWGLGHSFGVLIVGVLALLLRELIPIDAISGWSEKIVGLMLIGIGLWGLHKAFTKRIHIHKHYHDGEEHKHVHLHSKTKEHDTPSAHIHMHAAMGIGILHGLAGSSHFIGILPALAFPTLIQSVLYLIAFGIGTIVSMALFAASVGILSDRFAFNNDKAYKWMMSVFSTAALCVGAFWLIF